MNQDIDTELEKYLIKNYGLDNLLNNDFGGAVTLYDLTKHKNIEVWDFENNSLCDMSNMGNFCRENDIQYIAYLANHILVKQRFCLLENKEIAQIKYDKYTKPIELYRIEDNKILYESHTYNEWLDIGIEIFKLITNKIDASFGWYTDKTIVERNLTNITLYKDGEPKTLLYMEWIELNPKYRYVIDEITIEFNGYSLNSTYLDSGSNKYELVTLYRENADLPDNIEVKTLTKAEWIALERKHDKNIHALLNGSQLSSNGLYLQKEELVKQITPWTLYHRKENVVVSETFKYYEWTKKVHDISSLINNKIFMYKGYALLPENVPVNYKEIIRNVTYKDDKVLTYRFDETNKCTVLYYMDLNEIKLNIQQRKSKLLYEGKLNSIDGLYVCRDSYSHKYMYHTIYNEKTKENISDFYINLVKLVGYNFNLLVSGKQKMTNGWIIIN